MDFGSPTCVKVDGASRKKETAKKISDFIKL